MIAKKNLLECNKKKLWECNVRVDLPYEVSRIQDSSKATSASMRLSNIYQSQDVLK